MHATGADRAIGRCYHQRDDTGRRPAGCALLPRPRAPPALRPGPRSPSSAWRCAPRQPARPGVIWRPGSRLARRVSRSSTTRLSPPTSRSPRRTPGAWSRICHPECRRRPDAAAGRRAFVRGGGRRRRTDHRGDARSELAAHSRSGRERGAGDRQGNQGVRAAWIRRGARRGGSERTRGRPHLAAGAEARTTTHRNATGGTTPRGTSAVKPAAAPAAATKRELGVTLAGQTVFGAAPSVMPGLALYAMAALERDGPWAPALFLGATHVWRSDLVESGGAASFTLDAASLDACPLRLRLSSLAVRPCASALFGRLASQGSNTGREQPGSAARPFGAAGAVLTATFGSRGRLRTARRRRHVAPRLVRVLERTSFIEPLR